MGIGSLARITESMLRDTLAAFPAAIRANRVDESFCLAVAILEHFFGEDWLNKYVTPDTAKPNFLKIDESDQTRIDLTALRAIDLAEVLYNLQLVPGFDECVAKMRTGDIEGTYAETRSWADALPHNQLLFRYVVPQGIMGNDYDLEIEYADNVTVRQGKVHHRKHDFWKKRHP
jgi:hypothetical protein